MYCGHPGAAARNEVLGASASYAMGLILGGGGGDSHLVPWLLAFFLFPSCVSSHTGRSNLLHGLWPDAACRQQ